MAKKVFISFDYDNDRHYRYLLSAIKENSSFALEFDDVTPDEIQSYDVGRIKSVLTTKIKSSTHLLVIIGDKINSYHKDYQEIGERNWQLWEIQKALDENKNIVAVKINASVPSVSKLQNVGAKWAYSFRVDSIISALKEA
jgi:hypothetical protein